MKCYTVVRLIFRMSGFCEALQDIWGLQIKIGLLTSLVKLLTRASKG